MKEKEQTDKGNYKWKKRKEPKEGKIKRGMKDRQTESKEKKRNKGRRKIKKEMKKSYKEQKRRGNHTMSLPSPTLEEIRSGAISCTRSKYKHLGNIKMTVTFCYLKIQLKLTIRLSIMTRGGNRSICTTKKVRFVTGVHNRNDVMAIHHLPWHIKIMLWVERKNRRCEGRWKT
jgi:hypothetical protein